MKVYFDENLTRGFEGAIRAHPWTSSKKKADQRYVNFKTAPDEIERSLEDFLPFRDVPAVQSFYDLLRHINRPHGLLETNDCGFKPVSPNTGGDGPWPHAQMRCSGRVMLLFRNWWSNANELYTESLLAQIAHSVDAYSTTDMAVVGMAYCPVGFPDLVGQPEGRQVSPHWWTWGNSEDETWAAFGEVVAAMRSAIDDVEAAIRSQSNQMGWDAPGQPFDEP